MNLNTLSTQWSTRPDDQRFLSLTDLRDAVQTRTKHAVTEVLPATSMLPVATKGKGGGMVLQTPDLTYTDSRVTIEKAAGKLLN